MSRSAGNLREWFVRLLATLGPGRSDRDLQAELRGHLDFAAERARQTGLSSAAAARAAALEVGGLAQAMETLRDQRGLRWLSDLLRDLGYGWRLLTKSPGFTFVTITTLALGIGANVVIFCLAEALLLRPLAVAEVGRVVRVFTNNFSATPYSDYLTYRENSRTLEALAAFQFAPMSLRTGRQPEHVFGMAVTGNYFDLLGVGTSRGRTIVEADDRIGAAGAAMLSDAFWRSRFGASPDVVGHAVTINGLPFAIVGIAPGTFKGTLAPLVPDVWIPWSQSVFAQPSELASSRDRRSAQLIGRLKDGSTAQAVQAELTAMAAGLANARPEGNHSTKVSVYAARTLTPEFSIQTTVFVGFLMGLVGLILLIACVNIAGLLLARATARRHEIATRLALGANRQRLVVQLLTESALMSIFGGATALLIASVLTRLAGAVRLPTTYPLDLNLVVDWRVLLFALALSLLTTLMFGLAPAVRASNGDLVSVLRGERTMSGPGSMRMRGVLVIAQVAMSTLLLVTSGLLLRSLMTTRALSRGFSTDRVLTVSLDLSTRGYTSERGTAFFEQLLEDVERVPGAISANLAEIVPLTLSNRTTLMLKEGQEVPERSQGLPLTYANVVSRGHFRTLAIQLVAGRDFTAADRSGAPEVAIVNETLAKRLWPAENPLGTRLREWRGREPPGPWIEVVGMVKDASYVTVGEDPKPFIYRPLAQAYSPAITLLVKTVGDPMATLPAIRSRIEALDQDLAVFGSGTLERATNISLLPVQVAAFLAMTLGAVAVVLVAIGLYGILSYLVRRRTRELGIRVALGASATRVMWLVTAQGLRWTLTGILLGVGASLAVSRILTNLFYGIAAFDSIVLATVALTLFGTAFIACWAPGRWASRVDPQVALRIE